jgi:hypothetical protein
MNVKSNLLPILKLSLARSSYRAASWLELIPMLCFYAVQAVVVFGAFRNINGTMVSKNDLMMFFFTMCGIDAIGDALLYKGLAEYCAGLRKGNSVYVLTTPGLPLLRALLLRFEMVQVLLGLLFLTIAAVLVFSLNSSHFFLYLLTIPLGIVVQFLLSSAFHLVQAYLSPLMPIAFGCPASKLYSKPLHLLQNSFVFAIVSVIFYPVYFVSAFPAQIASNQIGISYFHEFGFGLIIFGVLSIFIWFLFLNALVLKSCTKWSK